MWLRKSLRPSAALLLTQRMSENGWSSITLSKAAHVSRFYVQYLMNFAEHDWQVEYLLSVILEKTDKKVPPSVDIFVSEEVYESLKSTGNISGTCAKLLQEWIDGNQVHGKD